MDKIKYVLENISREDTADYMADLLMDSNNSTYKMYEELASDYLKGNDDYRRGMNNACATLTGWYLETIAEQIIDSYEKEEN